MNKYRFVVVDFRQERLSEFTVTYLNLDDSDRCFKSQHEDEANRECLQTILAMFSQHTYSSNVKVTFQ